MAGRPSNANGSSRRGFTARLIELAGLLVLAATPVNAATDPRIVEHYRQMIAANPMEASALDRLWKIASDDGFSQKLLDEYRDRSATGDFQAQLVWAQLLLRAGRKEEAREAFQHAESRDPKSALPHLALAGLLEPAERAIELDRAAALLPANAPAMPDVLRQLGETWMTAGEPGKAAEAWEKLVAFIPDDPDLRQRLADLQAHAGQVAKAAGHYAWLEKHGDAATRVNALRALARMHQANDDPDSALGALERALALTASDNWIRTELVSEMIRIGEHANRVKELESRWKKEAAANPGAMAPWLQLAELYERQGALKDERAALEKALACGPGDSAIQLRLARLAVRLDDLPGAAALFDALLGAQPQQADLIFERAELDVRMNAPGAARARIEALEARPSASGTAPDEALHARAAAFFQEHRMFDAIEERLRKPGSNPSALAEFLFTRHRTEEARTALRSLVNPGDSPQLQAEAHQNAAESLKQAGDTQGALAESREAVRLQPESRALRLALGDLLLVDGQRDAAAEAFTSAVSLSKTEEERAEADQRLFRSLEGGTENPDPKAPAARKPALQKFIAFLEAQARGSHDSQTWLRLARWQFWARELQPAQAAASQAIALDPNAAAPRELAVAIATAAGDRTTTLFQLRQLVQAVPKRKDSFRKQLAQLQLQMGMTDEPLEILGELAQSGNPAALVDLAYGQQQADHWIDALATWERLYKEGRNGRRPEFLQPLIRALQRLEMHQRAADLLWEAYEAQPEKAARSTNSAVLGDLIAHCQEHDLISWLLDKLQARAIGSTAAADLFAFARALKAAGRLEESFRQLQLGAAFATDRAGAEEEVVKEAEALRDFTVAANHQQLRLKLLASPSAADWERLAALQECALDYTAAASTREEIIRRFPRDSGALVRCARHFEKWGDPQSAGECLMAARRLDPSDVAAAAGMMRLASMGGGFEVPAAGLKEAAETVLARGAPGGGSDSLILPVADRWLLARLQGCLGVLGGSGVSVLDDRSPSAGTEREWRLEAIRFLAQGLDETDRAPWLERWRNAVSPSEKLWAFYFAGARQEVFEQLRHLAELEPGNPARRFVLIWTALRSGNLASLADWLWAPERNADDYEAFRLALGEWCMLGEQLDLETMFAKAAPAQLWTAAEVFASHHRLDDAIRVGNRAFEEDAASHADHGLALASWMLGKGDIAAAHGVLQAMGREPAELLDAPTYAALRADFLLTPVGERAAWIKQTLAALAGSSPVHAALTTVMVQSLSGNAVATTQEALAHLAAFRSGSASDDAGKEQFWNRLLTAGTQLHLWNQDDAAVFLWERALADAASNRKPNERVSEFVLEIKMRLAAIRLAKATPGEFPQVLEKSTRNLPSSGLKQLAILLQESGYQSEAAGVLDLAQRRDPGTSLGPLLAACSAAKDEGMAEAAIDRWKAHRFEPVESAAAVLEFVGSRTPARGLELANAVLEKAPDDARAIEQLAHWQVALGKWSEAEQSLRRLVEAQPTRIEPRLALADVLETQNQREAALKVLKAAPSRSPKLAARVVELKVASGSVTEARVLAEDLLTTDDLAILIRMAKAFASAGRLDDALALLGSAVSISDESGKPWKAFKLQRQFLELAGPDAKCRELQLRRLRVLAARRPDLLSAYFELTSDSRWQPRGERKRELLADWDEGRGSAVAGGWLIADLLDANQPDAAGGVLSTLLQRRDAPDPLLTWLEERFKRANRHDSALAITDTLLTRAPDSSDYVFRRARSLHALGRDAEVSTLLERTAEGSVFAPELGGRIGLVALDLGDTRLARQLLAPAVATGLPGLESEVFLGYARLLMAEGDFPAARRVLQQAFRNPKCEVRVLAEYLRKSGRPAATELRDLALPNGVAEQARKLLAE